jgi:sortase A
MSAVMIAVGLLLLLDAGITLAWQEPVSALYARLQQSQLDSELDDLENRPLAPEERTALAKLRTRKQRLNFLARSSLRRAETGDPIGRIVAPDIDLRSAVVEGTSTSVLRKGPGRYPETAFPGQGRTVAVAGHRTTYGAPFRRLDDLRPGDEIRLDMPYARFSYRVERTRIVRPHERWVTRSVGYERIVLTACEPLYSAAKRIVVFARLRDVALER